jgi:hypothetical protein
MGHGASVSWSVSNSYLSEPVVVDQIYQMIIMPAGASPSLEFGADECRILALIRVEWSEEGFRSWHCHHEATFQDEVLGP